MLNAFNLMVIGSFRSIKSVKPNCKGVLKGFSCWFKMWKVLGN